MDDPTRECLAVYSSHGNTGCKCKKWENQESCRFSKKSAHRSCCMFYLDIDGGFCDNLEAQKCAAERKGSNKVLDL